RAAELLLRLRQARALGLHPGAGFADELLGASRTGRPHVERLRELRALAAPLHELRTALGALIIEARAGFLGVPHLGLEARDFRVRCIERGLRCAHGIARAKV